MIVRTTAIPLAYYPYSTTSRIVHWLTRHHGKISTLLKGALRPKSPFLGEYELFSTSELLYFSKPTETLHTGKECAILQHRDVFRTDWRAMQSASYLSYLFNKTTPDEAPHPELFEFYEELMDFAAEQGRHPQFIAWAELQFSEHHGHAPNLAHCVLCSSKQALRFCASLGGVVCSTCSKSKKLPTLESTPDVLAILRGWQNAEHPGVVEKTHLSGKQLNSINAITSTFLMYHFDIHPKHRNATMPPFTGKQQG